MTYREAKEAGYTDADRTFQRGYISRKTNIDDQPVLTAGGHRKGDLYILLPHYTKTCYCYRQYLAKDGE